MNYFSHFYFDHISNNHEYNTGLILPDLTRKWIKKKIPQKINDPENHYISFSDAWIKHHQTDRLFHSSKFFEFHNSILNEMMKKSDLSSNAERKWFLSHITLELLIDRIIVAYDKISLGSFYHSLNNANLRSLNFFLNSQGLNNTDKFLEFFNHFRTVQYIYYYSDNNKFVFSLNKIMLRAKLNELSESDSLILTDIIIGFEKKYFTNHQTTINEIRDVLK